MARLGILTLFHFNSRQPIERKQTAQRERERERDRERERELSQLSTMPAVLEQGSPISRTD